MEEFPLNRVVAAYSRWEDHGTACWRWYDRATAACGRTGNAASIHDAPDFAEALCQAIWHLKDWLKHDSRQTLVSRRNIETFVNENTSLKLIADLANGSKRLVVTGRGDRSKNARFAPTMWIGDGDPNDPTSVTRVYVTAVNRDLDQFGEVIDLALAALEAWRTWLESHGLDVTASTRSTDAQRWPLPTVLSRAGPNNYLQPRWSPP